MDSISQQLSSGDGTSGAEPADGEDGKSEVNDPVYKSEEAECVSDPELEELLDVSLSEFGKHLPPTAAPVQPRGEESASSPRMSPVAGTEDFEEIFSEEFAAQAEAQLDEAMQMLASENPELWRQLESFAQSVAPSADVPEGQPRAEEGGATSLDAKLEETIRQLRQSTEQIESGKGGAGGLSELLGGLDLGAEGTEDSLMQVMEGVMSTLLSKDVLYPSLSDLCSQYPEWLASHKQELSPEEYSRYAHQLEAMRAICGEFESASENEGEDEKQARFERILQLMQQLQQYGQPPDELAGQANLPTHLPDSQVPQNCAVM